MLDVGPTAYLAVLWKSFHEFIRNHEHFVSFPSINIGSYLIVRGEQFKAIVPWAVGAITLSASTDLGASSLAVCGIRVRLVYGAGAGAEVPSFSVVSVEAVLRSVLFTSRPTIPAEWKSKDCGIIEFSYTRAGRNGVITFVHSCTHVFLREMVYVTCIGREQRLNMLRSQLGFDFLPLS